MDNADLAVLGLIGNYGWGSFRPIADVRKRPLSAKSRRSKMAGIDPKRALLKRVESCLSRSGLELLRYLRQSMNDIRNHLFSTVHPVNP